jgi:hypothetical protein
MQFDAERGDSYGRAVTKIYGWIQRIYVLGAQGLENRTAFRTLNTTEQISAMSTAIQNCKYKELFCIPPSPNFIQIALAVTTF